ncbi:MotA/TolQ/ExbB proton channel family protein [Candidatus Symbiobacter mobilis]|uniref:Biopolymer transport protein ExbB n=1 Tax=Candidatus Symbiobacter mobilis CR TaxID=946483 RepID=U5NAW5_9BURK|nr:MotA/TolQ/ExbB proton channel family protein [Candidatus Symbiobacter mobilis]AGX88557.1 biopolymer transport protein ExbB [Candidatus Symbiobacter mobilis CR]
MTLAQWLWGSDALTQAVALVLLGMSIGSWVVIVGKVWFLLRAGRDVARCVDAFWQFRDMAQAMASLPAWDRERLILPLVEAWREAPDATLASAADAPARRTRRLRDVLHSHRARLQWGQAWLASVGATAAFVGLLGTVWAIHRALVDIANAGSATIDKIAGPVGESLIMTAAGLVVAIPAVLAFNALGRWAVRIDTALDGFAHDLLALDMPHTSQHPAPEADAVSLTPNPSPVGRGELREAASRLAHEG